ncbi:hypothetical protein [Gorillibacterium sp. sgz5001074]|uniref:hypothetical protein n=1 Tax=Gorillibacterium sp. sgz5001074 TaxID=3446695 RepID=UPI003F674E75
MKYKILILSIAVLIASISVFIIFKSGDIDFDVVKVEELDKDIQDTIKQINEQNTYFIIKDKTIVVYSNLGKSGLYTYPYVEIKQEDGKLVVNINSHMAADEQYVKEILIVRINNIKKLPDDFGTTFLGQKTDYKIKDLSK